MFWRDAYLEGGEEGQQLEPRERNQGNLADAGRIAWRGVPISHVNDGQRHGVPEALSPCPSPLHTPLVAILSVHVPRAGGVLHVLRAQADWHPSARIVT